MIDSPLFVLKLVGLWLVLTTAASCIAAAAYPIFHRQLLVLAPARRSLLRFAYGLMPVVAASLVVFLMSHPSLAGLVVPAHCHADDCSAHAPVLGSGTLASAGFAAFGALGGFLLLGAVTWLLGRAMGRLRMLERLTRLTDRAEGYRVVESDGVIACCVGLLRPQVLVSRGVLEALPRPQVEAVLAHERAHAVRRDNLRGFVMHTVTRIWPRRLRQQFRTHLAADAEQACDARAASLTGNAKAVMDALQALSMPGSSGPSHRGVAFGAGDAPARMASLQRTVDGDARGWLALAALGLFWLLLVGVLTALSHAFIEWLTAAGF